MAFSLPMTCSSSSSVLGRRKKGSQQCQVLFALVDCGDVECWDLRDPLSPRVIMTYEKTPQKPIEKYDPEDVDHPKYVEGSSLGGWAIFVGLGSHGVALPAAEFLELKPNSIYFTDPTVLTRVENCVCGGHDIGIFNYEDKIVSRCYYPSDVRKIFPGAYVVLP
ncbi:hypothetical protein STAS_26484 [Striga asiatica]|uniref:KIB1-4 beta-propeller domain-containing protein n=1 Tax=Striga asiatica TaxID=4170 RepID=A0A5A7QV80_STRAF|nr:hypothetical protein STAS_26484 [Striga asiatica]